jgi:hypothetical protein
MPEIHIFGSAHGAGSLASDQITGYRINGGQLVAMAASETPGENDLPAFRVPKLFSLGEDRNDPVNTVVNSPHRTPELAEILVGKFKRTIRDLDHRLSLFLNLSYVQFHHTLFLRIIPKLLALSYNYRANRQDKPNQQKSAPDKAR